MSVHLVPPDAHAKPGVTNERFEWLGKLIVDVKPDVVLCLGDFADMYSLNSYERGKASFHRANYRDDIHSTLDAQDRMFYPIKRAKKKRPRFIMCMGNHEQRIITALNTDHILRGTIGIDDLDYSRNFEVHPFLNKVHVDDITYSHYIKSGNSGNAMAGKHQANSLLLQEHCSTTVGHSHLLNHKTDTTGLGRRIHGLVTGCYFNHSESYAPPNNKDWWRGVVVKRYVHKGDYDPEFISLRQIKEVYGEDS